jgi:hypothetical protein
MGEKRTLCKLSVWKPEGKIPLRRARHRCEENIKMNLKKV